MPIVRRKLGSSIVDLNIILQIVDGITTQIGLRFFSSFVKESNAGSGFILEQFGLDGLILEKVILVALLFGLRVYLGPRWESMSKRRFGEAVILLGGFAIIFLFTVITNIALIGLFFITGHGTS